MIKPLPKLTLTQHARWRMEQRGITMEEVNDALASGLREHRGKSVLHYDLRTHVAVLVDWREMKVITALILCKSHYQRLRAAALADK